MADANDAKLPQNAFKSAVALPCDRLSLLPNELLDTIYSLVFQFEDGPWTVRVTQRFENSWNCRDRVPSILASIQYMRSPRYMEYRAVSQNPESQWPDNVEGAFLRALSWVYRNEAPRMNEPIAEIIYELTGVRRHRKQVAQHMQVLKNWMHSMKPSSEGVLREIRSGLSAIQISNIRNQNDISRILTLVQYTLPNKLEKLSDALIAESQMAELEPLRPILDFRCSPLITRNAEIFRLLSSTASNPDSCYTFSLSTGVLSNSALAKDILLAPTLINRFHRTRSLAVLASNLVYDMGDDIKATYAFFNDDPSLPVKRVRLTFVEGYMNVSFIEYLARGTLTLLPNLRELVVELWPRNPTRKDKEGRSWGHQTIDILEALGEMKRRVVVEFGWEADCDRFQNEYVGIKGWQRVRGEEGYQVKTNDMCRGSYERKRN